MRRLPIGAAFAIAASAGFCTSAAWAEGPETAPARAAAVTEAPLPEYPPPSTRFTTAAVGLGAAGVFYGVGAGVSYLFPDTPGMQDLRKPVIGPWLAISHNECAANDTSCGTILLVARAFFLVLDGAAQAGSLAVMVEGLLMPTESVAATPSPRPPATPAPSKPTPGTGDKNLFWVPTPMTVGAGVGAGIVGRF